MSWWWGSVLKGHMVLLLSWLLTYHFILEEGVHLSGSLPFSSYHRPEQKATLTIIAMKKTQRILTGWFKFVRRQILKAQPLGEILLSISHMHRVMRFVKQSETILWCSPSLPRLVVSSGTVWSRRVGDGKGFRKEIEVDENTKGLLGKEIIIQRLPLSAQMALAIPGKIFP